MPGKIRRIVTGHNEAGRSIILSDTLLPPGELDPAQPLRVGLWLEGEVWAVLDEGETLMRPGDVLIQRGTQHAWSNRGPTTCRMLFVLIDAEPVAT